MNIPLSYILPVYFYKECCTEVITERINLELEVLYWKTTSVVDNFEVLIRKSVYILCSSSSKKLHQRIIGGEFSGYTTRIGRTHIRDSPPCHILCWTRSVNIQLFTYWNLWRNV